MFKSRPAEAGTTYLPTLSALVVPPLGGRGIGPRLIESLPADIFRGTQSNMFKSRPAEAGTTYLQPVGACYPPFRRSGIGPRLNRVSPSGHFQGHSIEHVQVPTG